MDTLTAAPGAADDDLLTTWPRGLKPPSVSGTRGPEPDRSGSTVWADSAYAGKLVTWAKKHLSLTIKTVSRPKDTSGFIVLPRRWVVERTWAWMMHARRHARDYEHASSSTPKL